MGTDNIRNSFSKGRMNGGDRVQCIAIANRRRVLYEELTFERSLVKKKNNHNKTLPGTVIPKDIRTSEIENETHFNISS